MSQKIKQEDGTEIEVFTPEEVQAKVKEKETELTTGLTEVRTNLEKALTDKKDLEAKLAAAGGNGGNQTENFKTLKEALDKKDKEISDLAGVVKKQGEDRINDFRDGIINKITGGNKDLKDKVLHHFNETLKSVPAGTQDEISKKIESAYKLSVDAGAPGILNGVLNGSGGPGYIPPAGSGPVEFTAAEKSLGSKMGISEEDYKKYGPKLKTKI